MLPPRADAGFDTHGQGKGCGVGVMGKSYPSNSATYSYSRDGGEDLSIFYCRLSNELTNWMLRVRIARRLQRKTSVRACLEQQRPRECPQASSHQSCEP